MLSDIKIKKAIKDKKIEIYITFEKNGDNYIECPNKAFLSSSLKNNLYSDRLKLTIGPIIKTLNNSKVDKKYRFRKSNNYDLRKSDNKYLLKPGESIIVLTNERVKLNGRYACLVIPRISMSDVGVVSTTAYVDPYYDGIMRLHLTNFSDKPYEIKFLATIAQCFFFELSDNVAEKYKDDFPKKSVFFGQTWEEILNTKKDPFPTKNDELSENRFELLKNQLKLIWNFVKKHSLVFAFLTNFITILCGINAFTQEFTKYTNTTKQIEAMLEPTDTEIIIYPGEMSGKKEVTVNFKKSEIVSVLCNIEGINYVINSGDVADETKIIFSYFLSSETTEEIEVNFSYVIVRRII